MLWKGNKKEIKTIDFKLQGERSQTNTLVGGVFVDAGKFWFDLNLPSHMLSDSVILLRGTNTKKQASLYFTFLKNSDGSYNSSNAVTVTVRHIGHLITATNEVLGTEDTSDAYPIECDIQ